MENPDIVDQLHLNSIEGNVMRSAILTTYWKMPCSVPAKLQEVSIDLAKLDFHRLTDVVHQDSKPHQRCQHPSLEAIRSDYLNFRNQLDHR